MAWAMLKLYQAEIQGPDTREPNPSQRTRAALLGSVGDKLLDGWEATGQQPRGSSHGAAATGQLR